MVPISKYVIDNDASMVYYDHENREIINIYWALDSNNSKWVYYCIIFYDLNGKVSKKLTVIDIWKEYTLENGFTFDGDKTFMYDDSPAKETIAIQFTFNFKITLQRIKEYRQELRMNKVDKILKNV